MSERCENCLFYSPQFNAGWDDKPISWQGDCRRYPPVITGVMKVAPDTTRTARLGSFPMVEAKWLCGEYREADTQTPEQSR